MATVSPGLRPSSMPLAYNNLRTSASPPVRTPSVFRESVLEQEKNQDKDRLNSAPFQAADPKLSIIDVENMLKERIRKKQEDLFMAFQNYDVHTNLSVTKGEFRRVLESYLMPVTTEQFDALLNKIDVNPNGTIRYCDFMEKFGASPKKLRPESKAEKWQSGTHKYVRAVSPKEMNTDMIEKMLKDKIGSNMKNVAKGLRLYDYNRDGHIQKHELKKVLENYCFRMSDAQFDKLYQRYDFHHRGIINYKEFLQRLGLHVEEMNKPPPSRGMPSAFNWQEFADQQRQANTPQLGINNRVRFEDPNPGAKLAGMALHSTEVEFRKLMRENYSNIKRMFMVFDRHNDGFIYIDDLKAVLSEFTLPMSDQLFSQLMDRCGVKASGKVSWEYFLEKFQDPQSNGNGQTITIKPGHRFNPIRGVDVPVSLQEIVKLLIEQVQQGYASLKQAFLEIDKNRDGKITRKELRKVLDGFKVRIRDDQMRGLYTLLDPTHSNVLSYHRFLDLFEERETKEGHKWLKSCHRFNEKQKPIIMAWETIEDILRTKLQDNWKDLSTSIINCDNKNTQVIPQKALRRCIERFSIPISEGHWQHMMSDLPSAEDDMVNYVEFLNMLGVSVKPGDLQGLSTQIHQGSIQTEVERTDEQNQRMARGEVRAMDRTDSMSVDEIITRIRDRMSQGTSKIRKAFLKYDTKKNGKVTKKEFRKVLESMGFNMSDITFEEVCAKLAFTKSVMLYSDFVSSFEDPRSGGPAAELMKDNNHRVNAIRGDEYGLTALEVESKLRNKLRENFEDLRAAFYKFDDDHNGLLTKGNLRRMLDAFMCHMTDDEFNKLCENLNISKKTRVSYKDFLEKFEVRDTEDGHKWLVSDHRFNEVKATKSLTAAEVHAALNKKAHQQYADLSKAFRMIDTKKDGLIKKNELKTILKNFILPIEPEEFNKLWLMYDTEGKGFVTHAEFLKRLGGDEFAPSDLNGMSYSIIKESYTKLDRHHKDQQVKHETITERQANRVEDMPVATILQQLKDRIREQYNDFYTAFKKYDTHKRGYLTSTDIQKVLTDFNYFVDDDQFYDLLDKLKLHEKRKLTYDDFLAAFQEGRKENYAPKAENVGMPVSVDADVAPDQVESKLRGKITAQLDVLKKAFQAFDQRGAGNLSLSDFRRVIDNFCFKLSDNQFKHVASKLPLNRDSSVDYGNYIESFKMSDSDADRWISNLNRQMRSETPAVLTEDEVSRYLQEQVAAKYQHLSRAFTDIDYARIGVVTRDDFRNILNQQTIRINDDQFDRLWTSQAVNDFGNIDYSDFLRQYTADIANHPRPVTSLPPQTPKRAHTSLELARLSACGSAMSNMAANRSFTPMVNAENVEKRLKDVVYRHWKEIQRTCRTEDPDGTGQIPYDTFRKIIKRLDGSLLDEDMNTLFLKYDLKNNNHFCYNDFLRHFVLTVQTQREGSLLNRKKMAQNKVTSPTQEEEAAGDATSRLKACVINNWKEMRRELSKLDAGNTGLVAPDAVRQVLRNYKLNLDEDEFHNVMSMYTKDVSGNINYRNFIKAFIQG